MSPILASDEMLMTLPPVTIITGSDDILRDDSIRLIEKLKLIYNSK